MSDLITFETENLLSFLDALLRDANGISEDSCDALCRMFVATGNMDLWHEISRRIDATDGRFYISDDAPSLVALPF